MTNKTGYSIITKAAEKISWAFRDATIDPSTYVARDIAILQNNEEIERKQKLSPHMASVVQAQSERAFKSLALSGYATQEE